MFKSEEVGNFSLLSNPHRLLVLEGPVDKKGTPTNSSTLICHTIVTLLSSSLYGAVFHGHSPLFSVHAQARRRGSSV